jgi:H+-transporting ATPase
VACSEDCKTWKFVGLIPISDPPREDTAQTIRNIRDKNIYVKMITGDHLNIAKEIGRQIDLGQNILPSSELKSEYEETKKENILFADGFAQVYPQDKTEVVSILQSQGMVVGMTGDGVNDAPALAKAQIGIAVEGATDAAKSAADIVLTNPGLSPINTAVEISRRIFKRLKSYVVYRICITVQVVFFLTAIAFISNGTFKALYIILLALLHDLQIVTIAYDKQIAGDMPETPTVMGLLVVSYTMGLSLCLSTVFMYYHGNLMLGPEFHTNEHYHDCAMFFQISNSSAILIFSARSVKWWFSPLLGNSKIPKPAWQIVFSAMIGQVLIMAVMRFPSKAMESYIHRLAWSDILYIWGYDIIWLFILDIVKQLMMALWESYEEANKEADPFVRAERKSATSLEKNVPGRKASFKRPSLKR